MAFLKKPQIRENQIRMRDHWYNMDPAYLYHGMYLGNCQGDTIEGNAIINYGDTTGAPYDWRFQLRGISLYNCNNSFVYFNKQAPALALNKLGTAVYTYGPNNNTIFRCNNFIGCKQGVFADGSNLGDQGTPTDPWNNEWNNFIAEYRVRGLNALPVKWFFQGDSMSNKYSPKPYIDIKLDLFSYTPQIGIDTCDFSQPPPSDSSHVNKVMNNGYDYVEYANENRFADMDYSFSLLDEDSLLRYSSTAFENFYDALSADGFDIPYTIEKLFDSENFSTALALNANMIDTNTMLSNLKTYNQIALQQNIDGLEFTLSQTADLTDIAVQIPKTGGKAVYYSRAKLMKEVDDGIGTGRNAQSSNSNLSNQNSLIIIPNPNGGVFNIVSLQQDSFENCLIEVKNEIGQDVQFRHLIQNENCLTIKLVDAQPGIYFVKLYLNNLNIYHTKVSVVK